MLNIVLFEKYFKGPSLLYYSILNNLKGVKTNFVWFLYK